MCACIQSVDLGMECRDASLPILWEHCVLRRVWSGKMWSLPMLKPNLCLWCSPALCPAWYRLQHLLCLKKQEEFLHVTWRIHKGFQIQWDTVLSHVKVRSLSHICRVTFEFKNNKRSLTGQHWLAVVHERPLLNVQSKQQELSHHDGKSVLVWEVCFCLCYKQELFSYKTFLVSYMSDTPPSYLLWAIIAMNGTGGACSLKQVSIIEYIHYEFDFSMNCLFLLKLRCLWLKALQIAFQPLSLCAFSQGKFKTHQGYINV